MSWSKRLSAPNAKERKMKGKFIVSARGPHGKAASLPLLVALRDNMALAENYKEGKKSIKLGGLHVDGKVCMDQKFGIGLMDIVHIPSVSLSYRVMCGKRGLYLVKIPESQSKTKICKITGKTAVKGGKTQYNLHDGRNIISGEKYKTGDSLVIGLPEQKVIEHIKFEEGNTALITTGKNAGEIAKIEKIEAGRTKRVWMKKDSTLFEAPVNYVMTVGKSKPAVAMANE